MRRSLTFFSVGLFITTTAFSSENPTGLIPLTPKELKRMQKELGMKRIKDVRPNGLGLKRMNDERARRNLPQLPESEASETGQETSTESDLSNDFSSGGATTTTTTSTSTTTLPTAVDNSTLGAFPSIGTQIWNSCAGWAMGYYQLSHNIALAMGWNNKTDTSKKCSSKFLYSMINNGVDSGAYFSDAFSVMQKHGCITYKNFPEDNNYRNWDLNPNHWQSAIAYRTNPVQYIYNVNTPTGLSQIKQLLNNGYVLTFGTYINSWQYTTVAATGQKVMKYMTGTSGGHAMTIVGYDDSVWVDINGNKIVDAGEKGVLKVANSWGTSWGNSGYILIAYDALSTTSAVSGAQVSGRVGAFQSNLAYHLPVKAAAGTLYSPKYLAKMTLRHVKRNQLSLMLGQSSPTSTIPTTTYSPFALMNKGGAYAFDGSTTIVEGTFVMDVSDLPFSSTGDNKLYLTLKDNTSGYPGTILSLQLLDQTKGTQTASASSALSADASSATMTVTTSGGTSNLAPVASFTSSSTSGAAPLAVSFDASGSYDSDGTIASYSWNFGDGTSATGAYVSKTFNQAGSFTTTLTVKDNDGATTSKSTIINTSGTTTTSDTTPPSLTVTNPINGGRYSAYSTINAAATSSDNVGVVGVKFYVNGVLKCTDYTAPYNCSFSMPIGTNIPVKVYAYDAAGYYRYKIVYISN